MSLTGPKQGPFSPPTDRAIRLAARAERAQARRDRYAARQTHERAAAAADRLQRRVAELAARLDRLAELAGPAGRGVTVRRRMAAGS
jgi:hypothetical protein